jgi:hypothetical protein
MPNLRNFRLCALRGFRRQFRHIAPIFLERGIANLRTMEAASLSVRPSASISTESSIASPDLIIVSVFEISAAELGAFFQREIEFQWLPGVPVYALPAAEVATDARAVTAALSTAQPCARGILCAGWNSDSEQQAARGASVDLPAVYARWGIDRIWRDDSLPCRVYLRHVLLAAARLDFRFRHPYCDGRATPPRPNERIYQTLRKLTESDGTVVAADSERVSTTDSGATTSGAAGVMLGAALSVVDNFLDCTFLGDNRTSVRDYLLSSDDRLSLLDELPPASFRERYSG